MSSEVTISHLRSEIPAKHCISDDARIMWLWNQRLATVANIYYNTRDVRSRMAASLVVNAAMVGDLGSIELVFRRIEGGPVSDREVLEGDSLPL